jgi:hypothetical protein
VLATPANSAGCLDFIMVAGVHSESGSNDAVLVCRCTENPNRLVSPCYEIHHFKGLSVELGYGVKRIYAFYFYRLGTFIHDLRVIQTGIKTDSEVISVLVRGADELKNFAESVDAPRFPSSIEAAQQLEKLVRSLLMAIADNSSKGVHESVFGPDVESDAKWKIGHFESMFDKELHDFPIFSVEEKGNFSLSRLLTGASQGYPPGALSKLGSNIINEIDESGRCIAFSRPTAAAFHILRALELLAKAFIETRGLQEPPPNRCNWGEYIQILRNGGSPREITDLLQIIKDNYRNPIMHPDETLDQEKASSLFNICGSAVEVICRHLP